MASIMKHRRRHRRRGLVNLWRQPLLGILRRNQWKFKLKRRRRNSIGISGLPMECVARILSFTSPRDVCRSSSVSSDFRSAAEHDEIWEKFLPLGYKDIISNLSLKLDCFSSKKDLFLRLCSAPILLDGGNKSLTIDNHNGNISLMLGPKELVVSWEIDLEWTDTIGQSVIGQSFSFTGIIMDHWRWTPVSNSRFSEAIELVSDYWHQISVGFEPGDDNMDACFYGRADSIVHFVKGEGRASGKSELVLDCDSQPMPQNTPHQNESQSLNHSEDAWMELMLGEFYNDKGSGEVEMILTDIEDSYWKSRLWMRGFIVQGIEIRPGKSNK